MVADHFAASRLRLLTPHPCPRRVLGGVIPPTLRARHSTARETCAVGLYLASLGPAHSVSLGLKWVYFWSLKQGRSPKNLYCHARVRERAVFSALERLRGGDKRSASVQRRTPLPALSRSGWGVWGEGVGFNFPWPSQCQDKHQTDSNVVHTSFHVVGEMGIGSGVFLPF